MRAPLAALALALPVPQALAEPPVRSFVGLYANAPGRDNHAVSAAVDSTGAIYILGDSAATASFVWSVVKYAPSGAVLWARTRSRGTRSVRHLFGPVAASRRVGHDPDRRHGRPRLRVRRRRTHAQ